MDPAPAVSVIIPAYDSHATVAGCLEALARQTCRGFEVLVIDSGPDGTTEELMARFPWVRYRRSPQRLLPHAARNVGAGLARGSVLVFTDPDVYAHPDWLDKLLAAHRATSGVVVGALACHGGRWLDQGIHLCKFSKWLPGGSPRPVDMSPTANMLVPRRLYEEAGGFPDHEFLGDVTFSRRLLARGRTLHFEPGAVVAHHHTQSLLAFLEERATRGRMYGDLRLGWVQGRRGAVLLYLLVTVVPIRLARILALVAGHARGAGQTGRLLSTLPVVAAGHAAALAGEALAYASALVRPRPSLAAPAGGPA